MSGAGGPEADDSLVKLGVISRPQGVRGEVRVHPFNADSTLLGKLKEVLLCPDDGEPMLVRVEASRRMPKVFVFRLEGVRSYEAADELRGLAVSIPREFLPEPEDDEYYLIDLVGLKALREDESLLGEVVAVMQYPTADCIRIRCEDGHREIPLMPRWVQDVDIEAGEVRLGDVEDIPLEEPRKRRTKKK